MEIYMTHEEQIIERLKAKQMLSVGELDCLLTTKDTETVEKLKAEARMRHSRYTENRSISAG